jgi:hypothetical protein
MGQTVDLTVLHSSTWTEDEQDDQDFGLFSGGTFTVSPCQTPTTQCGGAVCMQTQGGAQISLGRFVNAPSFNGDDVTVAYTDGGACHAGSQNEKYTSRIQYICGPTEVSRSV